MARVLIIEDDPKINRLLGRMSGELGHESFSAFSLSDGLASANQKHPDVVFLDLTLPDGNGLSILSGLMTAPSEPEVIIVTGTGDQRGAEVAFRNGAWDFIAKPFHRDDVVLSLTRALQYHAEKMAKKTAHVLRRKGIIGSSPILMACLEQVAGAARTDITTLITGETGSGKELFARAIHENSSRAKANFVVVDCAALPENLVESTLFGHVKGAFTGAEKARIGLIKIAHGGTLFLDEVGELPMSIQASFLRVLQERKFRPVGGQQEDVSDFRLVAATNRNLEGMVAQGRFRNDLLYRLKTFTLHLPSLADRKEDIKELVLHYIAHFCETYQTEVKGFSPEFLEALLEHHWPGNIRELINTIESALTAAGDDPTLYLKHLPAPFRIRLLKNVPPQLRPASDDVQIAPDATDTLTSFKEYRKKKSAEIEKQYLDALMRQTKGNINEACRVSGLSQSRLYSLLKNHDLTKYNS